MQKNVQKYLMAAGILFLLFAVLTAAVLTLDIRAIGPDGSRIGLSTINETIFTLLGVNLLWYDITDWLGVVAILFALGFALQGLIQLIQRKSLKRVDPSLLWLGAFYVTVIAVYVFFERHIVNYRPILLHGDLEASFPSSHTMIVLCIMLTAMMQFRARLKGNGLRIAAGAVCGTVIAVTVVGRFISGVHWFTDIMAGLLLGLALCMLYGAAINHAQARRHSESV